MITYLDLLARLHAALQPQVYLEIGVEEGEALEFSRSESIAIRTGADSWRLKPEAPRGKPWLKLFQQPSDDFFRTHGPEATLEGGKLDLAVIDGLHQFAQVARDLAHVERWGHAGTVVVIHDVLPWQVAHASRSFRGGPWTGDVWRIVPFLREQRPDLACRLVDAAHTGALIVTNLDPSFHGMAEQAAALDRDFPDDGPHYDELVAAYLTEARPEPTETVLREMMGGYWPRRATPPGKDQRGPRDAVIFAWWTPDNADAEQVGAYYVNLLRAHHADSKIFVGINHGTAPSWPERLVASGLDIEVRMANPEVTVDSDVTGFLTALEAYHESDERFDLVWFGHTKGASRPFADYETRRAAQEHRFWGRRAEIERMFADPKIGLYAPHFCPLPQWSPGAEFSALQRIYRDRYVPLGLHCRGTFYVMREEIVREFCRAVDNAFFRTDPREYGADRWFFEIGMPSIASMQGYEPFIEMHVPGANDPRDNVWFAYDIRQNHRIVAAELERWRENRFTYEPRQITWVED
jgi:hypothetical protein